MVALCEDRQVSGREEVQPAGQVEKPFSLRAVRLPLGTLAPSSCCPASEALPLLAEERSSS